MAGEGPIPNLAAWPEVSLVDLTEKIGSGATPRGGADSYLPARTRYALVRSQNVFDRHFDRDGLAFITDEQAARLRGAALQPGDLLLNITGDGITFGRSCIVPSDVLPACVNQHVSIIRVDRDRASAGFVLAFLTHPDVKPYIESFNAGGSRRAITKGHIESFRLPLPSIHEQRRIAAILGALDDKIELNRKMNGTLEAIAQAVFKSWFIDFDGHDDLVDSEIGPVPTGWSVGPIGTAVQVVGGSTPSTKEPAYWAGGTHAWATPKDLSGLAVPVILGTERQVTDAGLQKISSGLLPAGTFLLSSRAPIGYTAIARVPVAINQGFIAVPPGGALPASYLLFWTRSNMEGIKGRAGGTTFPEISKAAFRPILVLLPPAGRLAEFEAAVGPLLDHIVANVRESRTLAELRDALLPKLISGELRVEAVE